MALYSLGSTQHPVFQLTPIGQYSTSDEEPAVLVRSTQHINSTVDPVDIQTVKIVVDLLTGPVTRPGVLELVDGLIARGTPAENVTILVRDASQIDFVKSVLAERFYAASIDWYPWKAHHAQATVDSDRAPSTQRSRIAMFMDTYSQERFELFFALSRSINRFRSWAFSFSTQDADGDTHTFEQMMSELAERHIVPSPTQTALLRDAPYTCEFPIRALRSTGLVVAVPGNMNPYYSKPQQQELHTQMLASKYSPVDIPMTAWRAIALGKPFVVPGRQGYIHALKQLGFRSFSPYINEDYDDQTDDQHRLSTLTQELARLSSMSDSDFYTILERVQARVAYNTQVFNQLLEKQFDIESRWLRKYLHTN